MHQHGRELLLQSIYNVHSLSVHHRLGPHQDWLSLGVIGKGSIGVHGSIANIEPPTLGKKSRV